MPPAEVVVHVGPLGNARACVDLLSLVACPAESACLLCIRPAAGQPREAPVGWLLLWWGSRVHRSLIQTFEIAVCLKTKFG